MSASERLPLLKSQSAAFVALYEDLLDSLLDAMEKHNVQEVDRLMRQLSSVRGRMESVQGVKVLMDAGRYGVAARQRIREMYCKEFASDACSVLQLRGGGVFDCCSGATEKEKRKHEEKLHPHPPDHSFFAAVRYLEDLLDNIFVSFFLTALCVAGTLMNLLADPRTDKHTTWPLYVMWSCLGIISIQPFLNVILRLSKRLPSTLVHGRCVVVRSLFKCKAHIKEHFAGVSLEAAQRLEEHAGVHESHELKPLQIGEVRSVSRYHKGAFIEFEDPHKVKNLEVGFFKVPDMYFVKEKDYINIAITTGLCEYFTNTINLFGLIMLALSWVFSPDLIWKNGKCWGGNCIFLILHFFAGVVKHLRQAHGLFPLSTPKKDRPKHHGLWPEHHTKTTS